MDFLRIDFPDLVLLTLVRARGVHRMKYRNESCDPRDTKQYTDLPEICAQALSSSPSRESSGLSQLRVRIWEVYQMLRSSDLQT